jgi:hypothetical protein
MEWAKCRVCSEYQTAKERIGELEELARENNLHHTQQQELKELKGKLIRWERHEN